MSVVLSGLQNNDSLTVSVNVNVSGSDVTD